MPDNQLMQAALGDTIQSRTAEDRRPGSNILLYLVQGSGLISPWWSIQRDKQLRNFWKPNDYLGGAVYTICSRISTIPLRVKAFDENIESHNNVAYTFEHLLLEGSEFGSGLEAFLSKWVEDLVTQDNGAFAEVIGPGDPTGPISGLPVGLAHIDSGRCTRTSNPEFPVLYQDTDGKFYKLHFTRVAYASLQPSPIAEMNGVGFSSLSRCINNAQHLMDMLVYKQEKLGSRPSRGIMVTKGGLDPEDIKTSMALVAENSDNAALSRYSKIAVVGSSGLPEAGLQMHDLSSLPDGFDEQQSTTIGMAAIALAFGVDPRELWPGLSVGTTRAEALVAHLKARTKGIGQIIAITEHAIGQKMLPPTVYMEFDYQDDAQDKQQADIRSVRSATHETDLRSGVVDVRVARQQSVEVGDLSWSQFEQLELADGRLADGASVLSLFAHPDYRAMLDLGVPEILSAEKTTLKPLIVEKRAELLTGLGVLRDFRRRKLVLEALAALTALEEDGGKPAPEPPALAVAAKPDAQAATAAPDAQATGDGQDGMEAGLDEISEIPGIEAG